MKKFDKWFFPDHEEHLQGWMTRVNNRQAGRLSYQYGKYEAAMKFVSGRGVAIDVGSHIGLWAFYMARDFERVVCFEPMPEHAECWRKNMEGIENAELWEYALGEDEVDVFIATRTADSSGDTGVTHSHTAGAVQVHQKPLDFFGFKDVALVKIDCEGYEEFVLRGGIEMLKRCKPCVIVEQKGSMSAQYGLDEKSAVAFLESLGAKLRAVTSGDYILSWD